MNQLDRQYQDLLFKLIADGSVKETRNGKTVSVFGQQIRHKMSDGFPLLTTKKMYWNGIVTELLWFLRGDTNIKYLVDNGCHIWDGDVYQAYVKKHKHAIRTEGNRSELAIQSLEKQLIYPQEEFINKIKTDAEFAKTWGDLGPIYGKQWRSWRKWSGKEVMQDFYETNIDEIDQIANSIHLLKTDPDSRRNRVSSWNVGELDSMVLPPCHTDFQFYTRELSFNERIKLIVNSLKSNAPLLMEEDEKTIEWLNNNNIPTRAISLMWNQRSVDVPLGLPFNIASYGLLLEIIAKMVNMVPDELIGNLGDCHIYENQLPGCREQITREPFALPKLSINDTYWVTSDDAHEYTLDTEILSMLIEDFKIEAYESHPAIKFPLSN